MRVRDLTRAGAAALAALVLIVSAGDVRAQSSPPLREAVFDLAYMRDDQQPARRQQLVNQIRAQLRAAPARSPQWASLQVTLGFALMGTGENNREALAAADSALQVLTQQSAPVEWAYAHNIRMLTVWLGMAEQADDTFDVEALRAQAQASERAALSVFTAEAYPQEHVGVRCAGDMLLSDFMSPGEDADQNDIAANMVNKMPVLAACAGIVGGRTGAFGNSRQTMLMSIAGLVMQGGDQNAIADTMMTMGRMRAVGLSSTLTLDQLGLAPAQLQRARALRAEADAALSRLPEQSPSALRNYTAFWRPTAQLYDILRETRPPQAALPQLRDPFIAPIILDQNAGLIIVRTADGRGGFEGVAGNNIQTLMAYAQGNQPSQGIAAWTNAYRTASAAPAEQREALMKRAIDDFRARFTASWLPLFQVSARYSNVQRGGRLVVMTDGVASALPLGVLGQGDGSLIEEFEIAYTPSPTAYEAALRRSRQTGAASIVAVTAPDTNLAFAPAEARIARISFGGSPDQPGPAGKANVLAALRGASYWHFSTHGSFNVSQPRLSGLDLGNGQSLTLSDLYFAPQPLGAPYLVVLSACESGIADTRFNPDDFIGLPAGFMQAGAAGVIGSMWSVPDVSTALLMSRFYELHRGQNQRPSQALRNAQIWLKNATKADLTAYVDGLETRNAITAEEGDGFRVEIDGARDNRPFAHPYYWGAWVYYGA